MGCNTSIPSDHDGKSNLDTNSNSSKIIDSQMNVKTPNIKPLNSDSQHEYNNDLKNKTTKNTTKNAHDYEILLSSEGQLEVPNQFKKWFPERHGHKRVRQLFKWNKELGHGVTGAVHEIEYKSQICAVKQVEMNDQWARMLFTTEARVLSKLRHNGIIGFIDMFFDEKYYYLVLEKADFDLYYVMKKKGQLSERKTKNIIYALLKAIAYMHKKDLAHRDIKPENIVFIATDTNQPKLIDFGDAERARDNKTYTEFVGTPPYMSPERLDEHKGWQLKKADIWAIAVIAYEMYCGKRCFEGDTQKQVFGRILRGEWDWPNNRKPSQDMQDFIKKCLMHDAKDRPSAQQALNHKWFVKNREKEEKKTNQCHKPKNKLVDDISGAISVDEEEIKSSSPCNDGPCNDEIKDDGLIKIKDITEKQDDKQGITRIFENLACMVESNALQDILVKGYAKNLANDDLEPYKIEFDKLDCDKDGYLTGVDLINAFTANGIGPNQASSLASIIINQLDTNRCKKISFRQFLEARLKYDLSNRSRDIYNDILNASNYDFGGLHKFDSNSSLNKKIEAGFESENSLNSANITTLNNDQGISSKDIVMFSKSQNNVDISQKDLVEIFEKYGDGNDKLNYDDFVSAVHSQRVVDAPVVNDNDHLLPNGKRFHSKHGQLTKTQSDERTTYKLAFQQSV